MSTTAIVHEETATNAWVRLLRNLMRYGDAVDPRREATREIVAVTTSCRSVFPVVTVPAREIGYRFMAAEAAWILSGDNRVATIAPFSREISRYSDDGVRFFGAYGPPVRDQLGHVVRTLRADPASRQAVLTIWRPNPPRTADVPCTVGLQFLIRDQQLHAIAWMRSSDAWLGWPYDVFNFSMIAAAVYLELREDHPDIGRGRTYLQVGSQHLYARNFMAATTIVEAPAETDVDRPFDPTDDAATPDELVDLLWSYAHDAGGIPHGAAA